METLRGGQLEELIARLRKLSIEPEVVLLIHCGGGGALRPALRPADPRERDAGSALGELGLKASEVKPGTLYLGYAKGSRRGRAFGYLIYQPSASSKVLARSLSEQSCEIAAIAVDKWATRPGGGAVLTRDDLASVMAPLRVSLESGKARKREFDRIKKALGPIRRALEALGAGRVMYRKQADAWDVMLHAQDARVLGERDSSESRSLSRSDATRRRPSG